MSNDDTDAQLIAFPAAPDVLNQPPELPDPGRLFPTVREEPQAPPETPEETTLQLPVIPRPMDPAIALRSDGIPDPETGEEPGDDGESEYIHRRSLAERLGDWLEYRIALGQARFEGESSFREAEIARKVELLNARTAREVGLLEQQNKLRSAQLKARADQTAARAKSGSGLGADKGGRKNAPQSPAPRQQNKPPAPKQPAPKPPIPAPKAPAPKQPARVPAPKQPAPKPPAPAPKAPAPKQPAPVPAPKPPAPKQPAPKPPTPAPKQPAPKVPAPVPKPQGQKEGTGGRKGGAGSRDERDRTIRYGKAKDLPPGVRHGSAEAYDEHRCRCRRCVNAAHRAGKRSESKGAPGKRGPDPKGPRSRKAPRNGPGRPSDGPKQGPGATGKEDAPKGRSGPSGDSRNGPESGAGDASSDGPGWAGNRRETPHWPPGYDRPPRRAGQAPQDIVDADIVDDPSPAGLPRAPEPHTQRPGTTRPTAQEDSVAAQVSKPPSGQTGMAARHRTDVTFGEYLTEIVNIAIAAGADKERAQDLTAALGRVADALRDMAADLVGDHNIATEVVDRITDLADAADRMKVLAERCATECEIASEAALLAAKAVGRVYGEDMQAMDDAGLARASSAAHHD